MQRGDITGRFRIIGLLGRGGMAEVYLAATQGPAGFEKRIALKVPLPHLAEDAEVTAMFMDEARLAAQLEHRNIAAILELAEVEGRHLIAMEYVRGINLGALFKQMTQPLDVPTAAFIAAELAGGLHYAHTARSPDGRQLGIVHRDVSPSNVLLSVQGDVKLVDFGIAKATYRTQHTARNLLKGKAAYMAPEQANLDTLGPNTDQFSLGAVLFEMLTGRRLYESDHDLELLQMARDASVPDLEPLLPTPAVPVVRRMLARDPQDRYDDMASVRAALLSLMEEVGGSETRARARCAELVAEYLPAEPRDAPSMPSVAPTRRLEPERPRFGLAPWVFAGALACIVVALLFTRLSSRPHVVDGEPVTVYVEAWSAPGADLGLTELRTLGPGLVGAELLRGPSLQPVMWYRTQETQNQQPPRTSGAVALEVTVLERDAETVSLSPRLVDAFNGRTLRQWSHETKLERLPSAAADIANEVSEELGAPLEASSSRDFDYARQLHAAHELLVGDRRRAFQRFRQLAQQRPDEAEPYLWAGVIAWWYGPSSRSWLDELIADAQMHDPGDHVVKALTIMRGFVDDGHSKWREEAEALAAERPDDAFALFLAGEARIHTGDVQRGVDDLWHVLEIEPQLLLAETHPLRIAVLRGDEEGIERILRLRRANPTDPATGRYEFEGLIATRHYDEAIEWGLAQIRAGNADSVVMSSTASLLAIRGKREEAEQLFLRAVQSQPYVGTTDVWSLAMAAALYHDDIDSYGRWLENALPGGPGAFGHAAGAFSQQYRVAMAGRITELYLKRDDGWNTALGNLSEVFPDHELGSFDRTLRAVVNVVEAYAASDAAALDALADDRGWMPSALAEGLAAEQRGDYGAAQEALQRADALQIDGEYHAIIAHARARVAHAGGQDRAVIERNCDVVLRPRVLSPYYGALATDCKRWLESD